MDKRITSLAALTLLLVACGGDDDATDDGVVIRGDASISQPSLDAGLDGSAQGLDSATPTSDGSVKVGAPGCFLGTPASSVQLLNACADGYREFDNAQRIPGYVKGQLPAL